MFKTINFLLKSFPRGFLTFKQSEHPEEENFQPKPFLVAAKNRFVLLTTSFV
jgi:hypothetical protein